MFPRDNKRIIYCSVMLVYMIALAAVIVTYYDENICSYAKTLAIASLMWPMAQIDHKYLRIPNKLILLGLAYRALILLFEVIFYSGNVVSVIISEIAASLGIGLILLISCAVIKNGIGMGDIKFIMLMGMFLGVYKMISTIFVIMIIAFVVALYKLIIKKESKNSEFAFGPIIAIGSFISLVIFGN